MDLALAQLALIFLPGILWARLDATYGSGPKVNNTTLALNSFLFGVTTYSGVYLIYLCLDRDFSLGNFSEANGDVLSTFVDEILVSIPAALFLAILWLYAVRFRLVMKFLNTIGATTRFGSEDVWSFTFNSSQKYVDYVDIRDTDRGVIYSGYINAFSETEVFREILLVDAIVYDTHGTKITSAPHLYISLPPDRVWIEFPLKGDASVEERDE